MNIILWIVFGALVGWVASLIMGTSARQGLFMDIILGIVGALVGGFIMNAFGAAGVTGFNLRSFLIALVGAVIVIWIGRALRRKSPERVEGA